MEGGPPDGLLRSYPSLGEYTAALSEGHYESKKFFSGEVVWKANLLTGS